MKKSDEVRETIVKATIELIEKSDGDINSINTRAIAQRAQVGAGLINYHFQTKENLIELCVERMIKQVISSFSPPVSEQTPIEQLKITAKLVFDFLMDNPAVSKISILSDYRNPKPGDNTMMSAAGFSRTLSKLKIPEEERFILALAFTSIMQALFLRKDQDAGLPGYDLNNKAQRDTLLDLLIDTIFGGFEYE